MWCEIVLEIVSLCILIIVRIVSGIIHAYEVCNNLYVKSICEKRIKFFSKETYGTLRLKKKKEIDALV